VRLACPFSGARPRERHLWGLTCQLNFPLLYFASLWLDQVARASNVRRIHFVSRDCLLWHGLFEHLFPESCANYFYASRRCLLAPTPSYLEYFQSVWHKDDLIVDLLSTGISWSRLFSRLNRKARCFFIGHMDNYAYLEDVTRWQDWLEIQTVFRNSELGPPLNKNLEMLNYAPHARVEDVRLIAGAFPVPALAESLEYASSLPEAARQCFTVCVQKLGSPWNGAPIPNDKLAAVIKTLIGLIGADRQLDRIYAGHRAKDEAYMESILNDVRK